MELRATEILICDDHPIFRQGIRQVLDGDDSIKVVGEAANGEECLQQIDTLQPDLVLLDIRMPVMNGIDCLREIRTQKLNVRAIAMTQFEEKRLIRQMLRLGIDGYVLKDTTHHELKKAFRTVMSGRPYFSEAVRQQMDGTAHEPQSDPLFPNLGEKEKEVLWRICSEQSSKQIADAMLVSVKTVENQRSSLLRKTGTLNVAGLVKWAVLNRLDLP